VRTCRIRAASAQRLFPQVSCLRFAYIASPRCIGIGCGRDRIIRVDEAGQRAGVNCWLQTYVPLCAAS
jgi:hypothetical protein